MEVSKSGTDLYSSKVHQEYVRSNNQEDEIKWSNLIFLPFHPVFQTIVLICVIVKSTLGPLQSLYPVSDPVFEEPHIILNSMFIMHGYIVDVIYCIDTFLHIVHRQVTDKAMRREYMPKSAFLLCLDILALIPFYRLVAGDGNTRIQLWPNLLAFNEFLVVYRICEYFQLISTHSYCDLILGFCLIMPITINFLVAVWLLLTYEGLCANCSQFILDYDWRDYVQEKLNETAMSTYVYATAFVSSHGLRRALDNILPSTILEFLVTCLFMIAGHTVLNVFVLSKAFSESVLRLRRVCTKYPTVKKIIEETKRRNPSLKAHIHVETYYTTMWRIRSGIVHMPDILEDMPRYLRLAIKQDLFWPLFYHSPTLRNKSWSFKRYLYEHVHISYKLPGERFYVGSQCLSNLFYVKSGVVQLISSDDGTTPVLSVTSGTIFGDINFLLPHRRRKVTIRCLTYCEVLFLTQADLLRALHKFPEDGKVILKSYIARINHAKKLFEYKEQMKIIDRNEEEGIAWIKRRWWQIFDVVSTWKKKSLQEGIQARCELPPEESPYHCAKYLGQLVLCTDVQLRTKSMFVNYRFPWILSPYSTLVSIWKKIVICTVLMAVFIYPYYIISETYPPICDEILLCIDFVYIADLYISLTTAVKIQENETPNFGTILCERCKSVHFILDILSTIGTEYIILFMNNESISYPIQFNRLLKIHVLFSSHYMKWDIKKSPIIAVCRDIVFVHICFVIITSHFVYETGYYYPELTMNYFFGNNTCTNTVHSRCEPVISIAVHWMFEFIFPSNLPKRQIDIIIAIGISFMAYMLYAYCKSRFLAYLYLKYQTAKEYQSLVFNVRKYFDNYGINKDLSKRLEKHLVCHYKYYKGLNVMDRDSFTHEPFEIYWKVQGEVAQKIISESQAFIDADPTFIRELACASKYIILPKNAGIFIFGSKCKNIAWVVQGYVQSESYREDGELVKLYYKPGDMLSVSSVLFGKHAHRTYTCYTECEILYISKQDFFQIYKRYPLEWHYLETMIRRFRAEFEEVFETEVNNHKAYQPKLKERHSTSKELSSTSETEANYIISDPILQGKIWDDPESKWMQMWLLFRAVTVCVSIINASLEGTLCGVMDLQTFQAISALCDCIACIDIVLKMFLTYYDHRGLVIRDKKKCLKNYLTKGFLLDIIGAVPWFEILTPFLSKSIDLNNAMLINTCCKFAHIYIVLAYFNYIGDSPTANSNSMIVKWQVVNILTIIGASHYFMSHCVDYKFSNDLTLNNVELRNSCWMPKIFTLPKKLDIPSLNLLFGQSIHLAECGMMLMNHGGFKIQHSSYGLWFILLVLGIIFWFVTCYTLTLLVLASRENTQFQYEVNSLETFLKNERVEEETIDKAITHFRYCWMRNKGINIQQIINIRIGVVLGQDLSYCCFKRTYAVLNTLLMGDEHLQKQLASFSSVSYFLAGHEIMREMDLVPDLFIVHRGKVIIKKEGKKILILTKGDIFGQLLGTRLRPVKITAEAYTHTDVLQLSIKNFQETITDEVRQTIARNIQSRNDFLATKTWFVENPYDSIEYILRAKKAIQLPWMFEPMKIHHRSIYAWWLYMTWLCGPCGTAFIVVILPWTALPPGCVRVLYIILILLDVLHITNFIAEFYSTKLIVEDKKCVRRIIGFGIMRKYGFYIDLISLIIPLLSFIQNDRRYQFVKLLRLKWLFNFDYHFCQGFKTKAAPRALKTAIILLLLHTFTCGWIYVACSDEQFPLSVPQFTNKSIDLTEWTHPDNRKGGCARAARRIFVDSADKRLPGFVVPVHWSHDYVIALTFILLIHTHTTMDTVMPITTHQVYYKMLVTYVMYLLDMWLIALAISGLYTRFRIFYHFDYHLMNLTTFLKESGLYPSLLNDLREYTNQLWKKHRGNWLPEIAFDAPVCLREDLFVALYMHHLNRPSTFRQLPYYFKRQLAARLERTVILPGKYIVQEGDVLNVTYFIHEGEVEKWHNNAEGEGQFLSLLYTNGYFGCMPGLFANSAFQFSYITRTVVDLVYLRLTNWEDLLEGYPEIKKNFYEATKALKQEAVRTSHGELHSTPTLNDTCKVVICKRLAAPNELQERVRREVDGDRRVKWVKGKIIPCLILANISKPHTTYC